MMPAKNTPAKKPAAKAPAKTKAAAKAPARAAKKTTAQIAQEPALVPEKDLRAMLTGKPVSYTHLKLNITFSF